MGNRDNYGRFAAGQQIRGGRPPDPSIKQQTPETADACCANNSMSQVARAPNPIDEAEKSLAMAREHERLAHDARSQLDAQMPFFGQGLEAQSEALFSWFSHQGFWPAGWEPHASYFDGPGQEDSPASEYRRMKKSEKLALIHSEISECLEAVRKNDAYNEAEELADAVVRILDYAGGFGIDLSGAYYRKMLANYQRPHRHGKKF